jgi:hypothetical protein
MTAKVHAAAGTIALLTICTFWLSTVAVELVGTPGRIAAVKTAILYGMALLIPAMVAAGASGAALGRGMKLPQVAAKARRMKLIAANGVILLLPSAVFLALRARPAASTAGSPRCRRWNWRPGRPISRCCR